jgi:hypothetical protein
MGTVLEVQKTKPCTEPKKEQTSIFDTFMGEKLKKEFFGFS